jgi:hypothetical protein
MQEDWDGPYLGYQINFRPDGVSDLTRAASSQAGEADGFCCHAIGFGRICHTVGNVFSRYGWVFNGIW